jgi:hypothetical protein
VGALPRPSDRDPISLGDHILEVEADIREPRPEVVDRAGESRGASLSVGADEIVTDERGKPERSLLKEG